MAFHLNMQGSCPTAGRLPSSAAQILSARGRMRVSSHIGYLESPKMHVMSAVLMFVFGLTIASTRMTQLANAHAYDMTPTGSIAAKSPPAEPKHRGCE